MRYLVDTDWGISYLHGLPQYAERLNVLLFDGVGISLISLAELYEGLLTSSTPEKDELILQDFLASVEPLTLDDETCRIFARERRRLRAAGTLIGDFDLLIGATALRHDLTLLTNNRRHFERIYGLTILSV